MAKYHELQAVMWHIFNTRTGSEVFQRTNAKVYLRFAEVERGKRRITVPSGRVLTFGSTAPLGALYEGPTDRAIIQKMLADGRPVSSVPGQGASVCLKPVRRSQVS
jgi:hypothetical protein